MPRYFLNIDGGSRGNPGPGAAAAVVTDERGGVLAARGWFLGHTTNNVAEYTGLVRGLRLVGERGLAGDAAEGSARDEGRAGVCVVVRSDSELLVKQMRGEYRVRDAKLQPLFAQARELAAEVGGVRFEHVPRERNREADALANRAMDVARDVGGEGESAPGEIQNANVKRDSGDGGGRAIVGRLREAEGAVAELKRTLAGAGGAQRNGAAAAVAAFGRVEAALREARRALGLKEL